MSSATLEDLHADVLVLGMGASGLMAASALAQEGKSVLVVGRGMSATSLSTGCISFIRQAELSREEPRIDVETLAKSVHPFSDLIERSALSLEDLIAEMSVFLVRGLADQGLEMTDDVFHYHRLLTNIGSSYSCSIAPASLTLGSEDKLTRDKWAVLGLLGAQDLDADLFATIVNRRHPRVEIRPLWIRPTSFGSRQSLTSLEVASIMSSEAAVEEVVQAIKGIEADNVCIPPLFSLAKFEAGMRKLRKLTGKNIFEPVTPMSLAGMRLQEALERLAASQGCQLLRQREVTALRSSPGRVDSAVLTTRTRTQKVSFNSIIVASGDLVAGGLGVAGAKVDDPLQTFKIGTFGRTSALAASATFGPMDVAMETGMLVNNEMRLMDREGRPFANAFGAGAVLAGFSYPTGVGLGGGLLTAWVAAKHAMEGS